MTDPCDGWSWRWPANGYPMAADRALPMCIEGFDPRDVTADHVELAAFLPYVRTDWSHWGLGLDWTLESGPDDAPSCLEIEVPYSYRGGGPDYFAGGCWNPGDPVEVETGVAWFVNEHGERGEVSLLQPETERVELHIAENPPEPDYGDDY